MRLFAAIAFEHALWRSGCDAVELAARIARRAYLHERIARARSVRALVAAAAPLMRAPCRVAAARYVFTAEEVLARILEDVDVTQGVTDGVASRHAIASDEPRRALAALPELERRLVELLADGARTYWVSPRTSARLHALIENPDGTVVLTIKPPGSEVEIEIKRAGTRGAARLDVRAYEDGKVAPLTHHLWGGAQCDLLRWERGEANLLSRVYRLAHREEAPISRTIAITSIYDIPGQGNVIEAFAHRDAEAMRVALRHLEADDSPAPPFILATRFIGRVHPAQAIQIGNSSFRLHRVAERLAARRGDRNEADELLEECIAGYAPPPRRGGYASYVAAAFRANADGARRAFIDCAAQLGTMLGTVAGARGGSSGESFTARNVGLRCVRERGAWRVRLTFMDHDALNIYGRSERDYHPRPVTKYLALDIKHAALTMQTLEQIYRPSRDARAEGRKALQRASRTAYLATLRAIESASSLFHASFRKRLRDLDRIVARLLITDVASWRTWTRRYLGRRGYEAKLIDEYLVMLPPFRKYWRRAPFL